MYLVTNREIKATDGYVDDVFGERPNALGPNELRVATVDKRRGKWKARLLEDELPQPESEKLIKDFNLSVDPSQTHYADMLVACNLSDQARRENKNILLFVHGYNNDIKDVLERAARIEARSRPPLFRSP